uniref:Uncharacterized protein n=1 Tax=Arundo donax TaxID=35708 RepID=A0A0A9DKH4_ARUDO
MTNSTSAALSSRRSTREPRPSASRLDSATGRPMHPRHLRPSGMDPIARSTHPAQYRAPQARHDSLSPRPQKPLPFPHLQQPRDLGPLRSKCAGEREPLDWPAARGRASPEAASSSSSSSSSSSYSSSSSEDWRRDPPVSAKVTVGWWGFGGSAWRPASSAPSSSEGDDGSSAEWCAAA